LSLSCFLSYYWHYPVFCHSIATILFSVILLPISCFLYTTNCHYPVFCHIITNILFSIYNKLPLSCFLSYYCQYPDFYIQQIATILFSVILLPLSCFLYTSIVNVVTLFLQQSLDDYTINEKQHKFRRHSVGI
jgi:hypothetical protein